MRLTIKIISLILLLLFPLSLSGCGMDTDINKKALSVDVKRIPIYFDSENNTIEFDSLSCEKIIKSQDVDHDDNYGYIIALLEKGELKNVSFEGKRTIAENKVNNTALNDDKWKFENLKEEYIYSLIIAFYHDKKILYSYSKYIFIKEGNLYQYFPPTFAIVGSVPIYASSSKKLITTFSPSLIEEMNNIQVNYDSNVFTINTDEVVQAFEEQGYSKNNGYTYHVHFSDRKTGEEIKADINSPFMSYENLKNNHTYVLRLTLTKKGDSYSFLRVFTLENDEIIEHEK